MKRNALRVLYVAWTLAMGATPLLITFGHVGSAFVCSMFVAIMMSVDMDRMLMHEVSS